MNTINSYLLAYLTKKDYSARELVNKMLDKGFPSEEVVFEVKELIKKNLVNDARLADNLIYLYGEQKGQQWLSRKLQTRLISPEVIRAAMAKLQTATPDLDYADLKKQIGRKYSIDSWTNLDWTTKGKIIKFLYSKGFTNSNQILSKWMEE